MSSGLAGNGEIDDDRLIARLMERASDGVRAPASSEAAQSPVRSATEVQALRRALEALVKALSGPSSRRFRIASTTHKGAEHEVVAVEADVTCSCPGFEYRGQCRHAREVKAALASGVAVPPQYEEVG
jgi:hypothetical protein